MGKAFIFLLFSFSSLAVALAKQCASQAGDVVCPDGACCSRWGWCGTSIEYCGDGCQSQCDDGGGGGDAGDIGSLISQELFDEMLKHRSTPPCPGRFYTYDAFVDAANSFSGFATTGDNTTRKREIAAFLAQTSHETTGGWPTAPDGPYSWGYCFVEELGNPGSYCVLDAQWPCYPGEKYYGRGPIQLS